jgi:hypothetical protein
MSDPKQLVLETGRPGMQYLSTRLVQKGRIKLALKMERPAVLLAYDAKSARAQKVRIEVLQSLGRPERKITDAVAKRVGFRLVRMHAVHWQNEIQNLIRHLGSEVLCAIALPGPQAARDPVTPNAEDGSSDPLTLARLRRERLLKTGKWYTAAQVAEALKGEVTASNPSQYTSRLRQQRRLLGVRYRGEYLHPEFQFDAKMGVLRREMATLLPILPKDDTGWSAAFWCFQPTGRLDGRRPADVFQANPKAVVTAAKKDFEGDDGNW